MDDPQKLRELAAWYREFAEKTGNPSIWESRLRMAEDLEQEADLLERRQQPVADQMRGPRHNLVGGGAEGDRTPREAVALCAGGHLREETHVLAERPRL